MAEIHVLPKEIAELIAAGEVVERPASVIKELVENSIDAGATAITVEIERGGITYMRVTDNGCGIARDEIKTAFLRHATSKIKTATDLDSIYTLGFRGEALASIAAVARVEIMSAINGEIGVSYAIHGGEEQGMEEVGCPTGTTIIVRDLFYNVPARMKFLKKDTSEANTVAAIMDRIALSHPEIAIKLIRDGKTVLNTGGDGKLKSAVYSVLGRDYSGAMIPVEYTEGICSAVGFTCVPSKCRPNRNGQFFFLNGRYIKSGTIAAALEQAYKNSTMVGKFPAAVLNVTIPPEMVDVNVHPTKTEVRFSEERRVFELIYRAVRQAIAVGDKRPELNIGAKNPLNPFAASNEYSQTQVTFSKAENKTDSFIDNKKQKDFADLGEKKYPVYVAEPFGAMKSNEAELSSSESIFKSEPQVASQKTEPSYIDKPEQVKSVQTARIIDVEVDEPAVSPEPKKAEEKPLQSEVLLPQANTKVEDDRNPDIDPEQIVYIGEAFSTYIIVSHEETMYFVDKHAAHERINFEKLKSTLEIPSQMLLAPLSCTLVREEYDVLIENQTLLERLGFELEDFGGSTVLVRSVPAILGDEDLSKLISEVAGNLLEKGVAVPTRIDDILHSIACKSAIKAGNITSKEEQLALAKRVLSSKSLMYCPHGRPIAFKLTKSQIEKQFGRLG